MTDTQWEHALHKDADLKDFVSVPNGNGKIDLVEPFDD